MPRKAGLQVSGRSKPLDGLAGWRVVTDLAGVRGVGRMLIQAQGPSISLYAVMNLFSNCKLIDMGR
jgi:hypothetical protein